MEVKNLLYLYVVIINKFIIYNFKFYRFKIAICVGCSYYMGRGVSKRCVCKCFKIYVSKEIKVLKLHREACYIAKFTLFRVLSNVFKIIYLNCYYFCKLLNYDILFLYINDDKC